MAVQELRKFKFFDLNHDVDKGALASALKDTTLTVATSGYNNFIFGDADGNIVFLNKSYEATIFKAYNLGIVLAEYIKHSPYLVTIGEDEPGINPLLKVWHLDVPDKSRLPRCVRVTRLIPNQKAAHATALGVHESANVLACGFQNGSILLFRGDVARDRNSKQKLIKDSGSSPITGLAFRKSSMSLFLFVTTENAVYSYDVTTKEKEIKWQLHTEGVLPGCSTMAELPHEAHFVVGQHDALYCYTADGKGPCYAIGGEKKLIQWSKSFLVIVSKEEKAANFGIPINREVAKDADNVSILDFHNNLIVSSCTLPNVRAILVECGSFYIITSDNRMHLLVEKDVQSKLALLFKKNLYDVAIRMAKSQHYDEDGLVKIFRQYGDHLNSKGDRAGAIEQYIKTIGSLEPSYIIRKFMDSAHMEQLMAYLEALHKKGMASGDHTTLLLNCYIKLGRTTDLKDFIMTKGRKVDFDIETALKVVRGVSADDALSLAKAHNRHTWVIRILLQDLKKYQEAIVYLSTLNFIEAEKCIMNFGVILMEHCPSEMVNYLKKMWTGDTQMTVDPDFMGSHESPRPHDFLHLFLLKSEYLVEFVEHLVNTKTGWDSQIYNALIEHYLVLWKRSKDDERSTIEIKLMKHLQHPDAHYDREHVLLLCQMYDFAIGKIFLYEENKMYYQVIQAHMDQKNYKSVLAACRRFGQQDPAIWIQALWSATTDPHVPNHVLSEILSVIEKERLQPALMTLEALEAGTTLAQARRYLASVLKAEEEALQMERQMMNKCSGDTAAMRARLHDLEQNVNIFQGSRCSICNRQLELPSVHFLCQHSYHQHCLQGYAENENECIVCLKNNKLLRSMIQSQENNHNLHETFHSQLEGPDDGFTVVSDYFGRGVFNKVNIAQPQALAPSLPPPPPVGKPQPVNQIKTPVMVARPRFEEEKPIALSLSKPSASPKRIPEPYVNPFEGDDDDYDETKNPFADDKNPFETDQRGKNPFEESNDGNPFASDQDDYDNELNPFA